MQWSALLYNGQTIRLYRVEELGWYRDILIDALEWFLEDTKTL